MATSFEAELAANGLTKYSLTPPSWQLPISTNCSNYAQFYPTRLNQREDNLSESVVKSGFTARAVVQTETFSAHQLIYEKLKQDNILPALSSLIEAVNERRSQPIIS
jgi:hypothetical protein